MTAVRISLLKQSTVAVRLRERFEIVEDEQGLRVKERFVQHPDALVFRSLNDVRMA
jgi:hypothetical protein